MYIDCHQNTVTQYIATLPIIHLCLSAKRNPELRLYMRWWEQPAVYILEIKAGHAEAEGGQEMGNEESVGEVEVE